jgi:hypothetical protein
MKDTADAGESTIRKKPSGTSTQAQDKHSGWVARRSEEYHKKTIDPTVVRHSEMKMSRTEHQPNNDEDSEAW